ncbi:hypothetical protein Tco_1444375 [Tanacetum coccineum]
MDRKKCRPSKQAGLKKTRIKKPPYQEQLSSEIISEEQLVPRANRLVIKKNNQRVALIEGLSFPKCLLIALREDTETDIRQKDEKQSQNDKTEHRMEEREKVKVKFKPEKSKSKPKPLLDGYDDFGTSTHTRNTPAEALTERAQQVKDQDLELLV